MGTADQMQSKKKLKPLQETQQFIQAALQSVVQAQAMDNKLAVKQTEQNIQKAQQTLLQTLQSVQNQEQQKYVENAQQQLMGAQEKLEEANHIDESL
ncbi:MAG: hypothetical protein ACO1OC_08560 [Tuberibacillus sp.]